MSPKEGHQFQTPDNSGFTMFGPEEEEGGVMRTLYLTMIYAHKTFDVCLGYVPWKKTKLV